MKCATVFEKWSTKPKIFQADHPFVFVTWDIPTNCILFMGRLITPL
jgi:serine protease inhibitor